MFSHRFARQIIVTRHARLRMVERGISDDLLFQILEEGQTRHRDATHLWVWLEAAERHDNLLCAVLVLEAALIVKTVLNHWELMP